MSDQGHPRTRLFRHDLGNRGYSKSALTEVRDLEALALRNSLVNLLVSLISSDVLVQHPNIEGKAFQQGGVAWSESGTSVVTLPRVFHPFEAGWGGFCRRANLD
jgi:hypothetical protein